MKYTKLSGQVDNVTPFITFFAGMFSLAVVEVLKDRLSTDRLRSERRAELQHEALYALQESVRTMRRLMAAVFKEQHDLAETSGTWPQRAVSNDEITEAFDRLTTLAERIVNDELRDAALEFWTTCSRCQQAKSKKEAGDALVEMAKQYKALNAQIGEQIRRLY